MQFGRHLGTEQCLVRAQVSADPLNDPWVLRWTAARFNGTLWAPVYDYGSRSAFKGTVRLVVELMGCLTQYPRRVQRIGRLRVAGCNGNPLEPPVQRSFNGHTVHGLRPVYGTFNGFLTPLCVRLNPTKDGYGVLAPCGNDGHGGFT